LNIEKIQLQTKQFRETGSVLHFEGKCWSNPQKSTRSKEMGACLSCSVICNIDSIDYKTLWVTISYSVSSFISSLPIWKLKATKPPTII
jgi:hypothetical protein